jgi:hypothetical protein
MRRRRSRIIHNKYIIQCNQDEEGKSQKKLLHPGHVMSTTEEIYGCILLLHWFICIEGFESYRQDDLVVVVVVIVIIVLVLPLVHGKCPRCFTARALSRDLSREKNRWIFLDLTLQQQQQQQRIKNTRHQQWPYALGL